MNEVLQCFLRNVPEVYKVFSDFITLELNNLSHL
jgi:hypothetical protein